jgi:DMSO reductase anchor subunit
MTKCDFCIDQLERGLPPVCVAACPMRVLNYGEAQSIHEGALWELRSEMHPYPLPSYSHTQPCLAIKPHPAMHKAEQKAVANLEEIQPRPPSKWEDVPLILFTLLVQLAVGGVWAMLWMFSTLQTLMAVLLVGASLAVGMFASFAHLGAKKNVRYALRNVGKSSLSREILFAGLFGCGWLLTALGAALSHDLTFEAIAMTSILGIGLIYNMAQVYRFPAAPGWNTWRTNASFMVSALLLGHAVMASLLTFETKIVGSLIFLLLLVQLAMIFKRDSQELLHKIRVGLIAAGLALVLTSFCLSGVNTIWINSLIFLIVLAEEGLGRWQFYRSRM